MSDKKPKKSSVRHTRAIQRDRTKRPNTAAPDELVEQRLEEIVHPATLNQVAHFHALGLRARTLNLPVMMAFVLSLIWRQLGSVCEAVRTLNREGLLWVDEREVSQQAVEQRFSSLPADLFQRVVDEILPLMAARWAACIRPLPPALQWAHDHFTATVAVDGSTLDALLRKTGLLRDGQGGVLAGRMAGLLDVITRLPRQVWYEEDAQAHDQRFWERILAGLERGMLLIFDLGFLNFTRFDQLTDAEIWFLTRKETRTVTRTEQVLRRTDTLHDQIVRLGSTASSQCRHPVRLVEWLHQGKWYAYLTNVVDPVLLPAEYVVALYWQRWRIEDSFNVIKRLLGLAFFWTGSINGIQIQVWATWILYAVLIDLTDAVAEALNKPFQALSIEMVYRGLYHFTVAHHRGKADEPIAYLAADAKGLGVLKQERKKRSAITDLLYLTIPSPP
ncbi:MAG: IS4 family transposase [Chloroflexales bacterium]|nr:IS4 family transposase [Chloroflexales bacterium]